MIVALVDDRQPFFLFCPIATNVVRDIDGNRQWRRHWRSFRYCRRDYVVGRSDLMRN